MGLRRVLAELLYPSAFYDQRAYQRITARACDAFWWLGKFPEACATLRWLIDGDRDERRQIGVTSISRWGPDISEFREQLRRGEHKRAAVEGKWQRSGHANADH